MIDNSSHTGVINAEMNDVTHTYCIILAMLFGDDEEGTFHMA